MRYAAAYIVPLFALCSPLKAQSGEDVPSSVRQGGNTGIEVRSGVEFQQFELDGGQEVEKFSIPVTASLTTGRLRITAQLPYVRVSGPENVVVPSGPLGLPILVDPTQPAEIRKREGIGDARVAAAYDLGIQGVNASLSAGAKLPTASVEKGLGTGEARFRECPQCVEI